MIRDTENPEHSGIQPVVIGVCGKNEVTTVRALIAGLSDNDVYETVVINTPPGTSMKLTEVRSLAIKETTGIYKSGKDNRRERRAKERKANKQKEKKKYNHK